MASPFRYFRKHQKAFLAVSAVLAMFIFVVGDAIMGCVGQAAGGRSDTPNTVVTTWDGGSFTARELDLATQRRIFLHEVLAHVYQLGKMRAEAAGLPAEHPGVPTFFLNPNATHPEVMGLVVEERLLADQAREAGMSVSDALINEFLRKTGFEQVPDPDLEKILEAHRRFDARTTNEWLFSGLRELLLGNLYSSSLTSSVLGVAPVQKWADWRQVNDRIALEAVVLPIDKFIAEVPEPTDAELIAFYEQNKDRVGGATVAVLGTELPSPQPGFREPRRVKLKYLMGDVTAWTQEMLAGVTDEEIADYYERNKRSQFVKMDEDEAGEKADDKPADDAKADEDAADAETESAAGGEAADAAPDPNSATKDDAADKEDEDVEYEPLDKVKDEIRTQLANDKAVLELKSVMESAYGDLTTVFNRYGGEVVTAEAEGRDRPPVPERLTDLAPMAKDKKLVYEETVPLSDREMYETMVGKAMDVQSGSRNVTYAAFTDLRPYEPFLAQDLDGYWYLVLKVDDLPTRVPELKEIRDEVVTAWKRQQAAALALKKAEELAKQAQEAGRPLAEQFADSGFEVTTTDLFSWITFGNTPVELQQGPRLGDAPPLTAVDNEFMDRVFALKEGEALGLLNFDHSQAYVVKLARRERSEDELRKAFLNDINNSQSAQIMESMQTQMNERILRSQMIQRVGLDLETLQKFLQDQSQPQRQ